MPKVEKKQWKGLSKTVLDSGFQILDSSLCQWNLDSGFQSSVGFRIPWTVVRIPMPRIPDSTSKIFSDSGFNLDSITWSDLLWFFIRPRSLLKLFKQNFSVLKRVIHFSFLLFSSSATPTFRSLNFLTTWVCWWKSRKMKANQHQTSMRYSRNFLC